MKYTRRDFLKTSAVVGAAFGISEFAALRSGLAAAVESPHMVTLTEWLQADRETRKRGVELCLQRIRELEPSIHAWVQVQPERPTADGPLSEIPFGAKDIIETQGMANESGSPLYKGRLGSADAAIVREMRSRGAILLGKTVTTAFAYRTPGPTRNPRNLEHTPGGSSSGSVAAVAAGMVPIALGTQTVGSVIRPGAFCGVSVFKPTFGVIPRAGVLTQAHSLDTVGVYGRSVQDLALIADVLQGHDDR